MSKAKRVLVTGGAGFLGSHLCDHLLADGAYVTCLDDLSTGHEENVAHLTNNPNFEIRVQNVAAPIEGDFDEIYNLACPASPVKYRADPVETILTCANGMLSVLKTAQTSEAKVLQASTSEIYGDPETHPQSEGDLGRPDPASLRACYEEGKRVAETLCHEFHRLHGVETKIARIFNCYGPRLDPTDGRVVSNFVAQALAGEPLTVCGTGMQTRSFCYVDDMIEGLMAIMDTQVGTTPVNIGNPVETDMLTLAQMVIRLTGSASDLVKVDAMQGDPRRRCPDITRMTQLTGWVPSTGLESGLAKTIRHAELQRGSRSRVDHAGRHPDQVVLAPEESLL